MPIKTSSGKWKWGNVERDSKKELVQTVYGIWKKNGSKGSFSDFLKGTHESTISENTKRYAYHCTNVDPEIIKKEGWKAGNGFTIDNQFKDLYKKYLPKVPVFVSSLDVPVWDSKVKYCIKLDITGLELFPDFGYLPDFGAYYDYEEECFYWENEDELDSNKKLKDFILNNCDNLTLYADCFDGEDSFNVLGTACVDGSKLKDRIVEYVSMQTEKRVKSESLVSEDKTSMIKKLVLPDIEDQKEKDDYKQELIAFFKSHSNFENKVDWNKFKTLTKKDFDEVIASADKTRGAEKRKEKAEIASDIKSIFKSQKGREFYIAGENDRWLFVAPLNYEAAKFCDSSENQGAGAKWCIGYEKTDGYWNNYTKRGSVFVMAFNKNYKNLSEKDMKKKLKFMIERDEDDEYHVWNQPDKDTGDNLSIFRKEKQIADKMFDEVENKLKDVQNKESEESNKKVEEILKNVDTIDEYTVDNYRYNLTKVTIPKNVSDIDDSAFEDCSKLISVILPDGLTNIGFSAFAGCRSLASITIPNSVVNIGQHAFAGCSKLTSIIIPSSIKNIGDLMFAGCSKLASVVIPHGVRYIGQAAFYYCSNLISITIPDSLTSIKKDAFAGCFKLKTVYCSEKIWKKFRDKFPEEAKRKDSKEMKKESLNEAHEIHSYPEKLQPMLERIVKDNEDYELDRAYFNKEGKFIWMRNSKGYFHVFKPVKFVKTPGMTKPFGFKDLILKDNGMLEEIDRLRFVDGNEGLAYLNKKYHLDLKTVK